MKNINPINFIKTLTLTTFNNRIEFIIYRKPTHKGRILENELQHHFSHKIAAFQ